MRTIKGVVTSNKMDKTRVVSVHTYKNHPTYKKRFRITKKFYVHDENNSAVMWDIVVIQETRPLSKLKRWELVNI